MSADEVHEVARRLRAAGRALRQRSTAEIVEAVGVVLERLRDADSPWRQQLERELPAATGFSPEVVRAGLRHGLDHWTAQALRELVAAELGGFGAGSDAGHVAGFEPSAAALPAGGGRATAVHATGFELTAVLLAGSIPMPTLLAMLLPLVLRSPVLVKPAARDRVTAGLVARALRETAPELGRCVEVVSAGSADRDAMDALLQADCIVATGSDETVADVASRVSPSQRLVGYGHRLSIALLGPHACRGGDAEAAARGLALDVALWDQLGCLSPVAVFVESGDGADARRIAEALAAALAAVARELPRGEVSAGAVAVAATERAEAEMRAAGGRAVSIHTDATAKCWTVVCEDDAAWRPAPLHRFVRVHPMPDRIATRTALQPLSAHLAGVAVAGFGDATPEIVRMLGELGASRVVPPGRLQAPPLGWHHDGRPLLLPLARLCDVEV